MAKDPNELGALWIKQGQRGEYMTGTIDGVGVVVFRNDKKAEGSRQPDWRVLKAQKPAERPKPAAQDPDDDIPY